MIRKERGVCDCGYEFTMRQLIDEKICPKCKKHFCNNCGSTKLLSSDIFIFSGLKYLCSNCNATFTISYKHKV